VRARRRAATATVVVVLGLLAMPPAQAAEPAADLSITSVRLTDQLVLRIEATYVCPPGFAVQPSTLPRAYAGQQTEVYPTSQHKLFGGIVCDGTRREVLVRFVNPRHPRGAHWEFDALTQVSLNFQASMAESPFSSVAPSDVQMVITRAGAHAQLVADITVQRRLGGRGALRVDATYLCPVGLAVNPALPPHAFVRQETDGGPRAQTTFDVVCDGTWRTVDVRFAKPRRPDGAQWQAGVLTRVSLGFQANTESPFRFVLAADSQSAIV
jgi:hypothetical protein